MKRTALRRTEFKRKPPDKKKVETQKRCKCGEMYTRYSTLQNKCIACMAEVGRLRMTPGTPQHKQSVREHKAAYKKQDDRYWKKKAQEACNTWIKYRDIEINNQVCITCKKPADPGRQSDAGHFRTVGANGSLRYCEQNINFQHNRPCNTENNDISVYEAELRVRYGDAITDWLKKDHTVYQWRADDLMAITLYYRNLLRKHRDGRKFVFKMPGYDIQTAEVQHWYPDIIDL